eukprot:1014255-Rhodomonas_salina.2
MTGTRVKSLEQIIEQQKLYIEQLERDRTGLEEMVFRNASNQAEDQAKLLEEENDILQRRCTNLQNSRSALESRCAVKQEICY